MLGIRDYCIPSGTARVDAIYSADRLVMQCACANILMQNMDSMAQAAAAPKTKRARLQRQFGLQSVGRSWQVRIKLDFAIKTLHTALILL